MTSNAQEFFKSIVTPTVAEFIQAPLDLRRGLLAAIVLNHMADHWAHDGFPASDRKTMDLRLNIVRQDMLERCPDFRFIQDIANVTKHAKLSITKNANESSREVSASDQFTVTPGLFQAPFGQGAFFEAMEVLVTLNNGVQKPLLPTVSAVFQAWHSKLDSLP